MAGKIAVNICIDCQNACGGCSWSKTFDPVPGWTAEKITRHYTSGDYRKEWETYHITACPLYKKDPPRRKGVRRNAKNPL